MRAACSALALMLTAIAPLGCSARASDAPAAPARLTWMSLEVSDMDAARRFYVDALGMKQIFQLHKPGDAFQKFGFNFSGDQASGESILILIHHDKADPGRNSSTGAMIGLIVPDVHAAAEHVRKAGYSVLREPPADAKGPVLTAIVRDPDGVTIEITELRGAVK